MERYEWLLLVILIVCAAGLVLTAVLMTITLDLRKKMTVQKLRFLGFYAADAETREAYAELTVGNRSLSDVGVAELGVRNGKISFDLTALYRRKQGLAQDVRVIVEQRSCLRFRLTEEELARILTDGKKGKKELRSLRMYCVDLSGTLYEGKIKAVHPLAKKVKQSVGSAAAVSAPALPAEPSAAPAEEQPAKEDAAEEVRVAESALE